MRGWFCGAARWHAVTECLIQFLGIMLMIKLLADAPGKAPGDGLRAWDPAIHMGDQGGVPSCWVQSGLAVAFVVSGRMNQQMKALWPFLSVILVFKGINLQKHS